MKFLSGPIVAASALLFFVTSASAHGGAHEQIMDNYRNFPDAQATVHSTKSTTVVHRKSPSHFKVCADHDGSGTVAVTYDDNTTDLEPGNCAHLEASKISAKSSNDGYNRLIVWEKEHTERLMDRPSRK